VQSDLQWQDQDLATASRFLFRSHETKVASSSRDTTLGLSVELQTASEGTGELYQLVKCNRTSVQLSAVVSVLIGVSCFFSISPNAGIVP
jgi:hypothetical protein